MNTKSESPSKYRNITSSSSDSSPDFHFKAGFHGFGPQFQQLKQKGLFGPRMAFRLLKKFSGNIEKVIAFHQEKSKNDKFDVKQVLADNVELAKEIKSRGVMMPRRIAKIIFKAEGDREVLEKLIQIRLLKKEVNKLKNHNKMMAQDKEIINILDSELFAELRAIEEYRGIPDRAIIRSIKIGQSKEEAIKFLNEKVEMRKQMQEARRNRISQANLNLLKKEEEVKSTKENVQKTETEPEKEPKKEPKKKDQKNEQKQENKDKRDKSCKKKDKSTDKRENSLEKATQLLNKNWDKEKVRILRELCPENDKKVLKSLRNSKGNLDLAAEILVNIMNQPDSPRN